MVYSKQEHTNNIDNLNNNFTETLNTQHKNNIAKYQLLMTKT